ncbi:MAG: hypothetical protein OXS47_04245 [Chloroflexota bacterium]|nr:hypothetical protein [Chloroflexota bacterium]
MRRRRRYYEPEDLGYEQDLRDAADPNRRFFVYVLDTDYGHYVGHTAHIGRRLREHQDGETESTAGGNPRLAWRSGPMETRDAAASFEAALKSLRDQQSPRFGEYTGLRPIPFANPSMSAPRPSRRRGSYRPRRYGRRRDDWFGRFLRREIRGIFRSRRNRRMWGAIAVGIVLVVIYASNGGF